MKKKLKVVLMLTLLMTISTVGGISAYLSDYDSVSNELLVGGVNTEIEEDFDPPEELNPGDSFTKDVKIRNLGPSDCYVRVKAVFTDSDMGNYCTVDWNASEDPNDDTVDYWYNAEDGFYYYKESLDLNELTTSLFTTVTLSDSIDEGEIKDFDILVYSEAYQADTFSSYTEAWEHYHRNKPSE